MSHTDATMNREGGISVNYLVKWIAGILSALIVLGISVNIGLLFSLKADVGLVQRDVQESNARSQQNRQLLTDSERRIDALERWRAAATGDPD